MAIGANIFAGADLSGDTGGGTSGPATADAMYGPSSSGGAHPLHPSHAFGAGFWFAVGGVVALVLIRRSLPG